MEMNASTINLYVMWIAMPNPFDAVMFVLLVIGALQGIGWLPW